ncbi:MAG TPA: fumarylacetoacetate hydrolase family protein [Burkholderiales bacterium]|jgi:2-keto-4-pentenoate hydratase/2-oxohepta-3-ene-1,7-dioic acid hydratase in catechol pathway|nr:fumarylacetoacetate hydrolase family protein [Burkholderiales bacterium]
MQLVTFSDAQGLRIGILDKKTASVIDLSRAAPALPRDMNELVALGSAGAEQLRTAAASDRRIPLASIKLHAPLPHPKRNIFAVGKNYRTHASEFENSGFDATGGQAVPDLPIFFTKATSSVSGPGDAIPIDLDYTNSTDYEGELTVVIGEGGRGIRKADALKHVYGYTIINDATARTLQSAHKQWFLGKSLDGYCPMGPTLVTTDEIPDLGKLRLMTRVNGELRQDAMVSDLIFDVPTLIETLSSVMTLMPGDLIATGTTSGVGLGFKPPKFLKKGDVVAITIEPIGTLENPVA